MLCDLDPKVMVIGKKVGICDGVPTTSTLVLYINAQTDPELSLLQISLFV